MRQQWIKKPGVATFTQSLTAVSHDAAFNIHTSTLGVLRKDVKDVGWCSGVFFLYATYSRIYIHSVSFPCQTIFCPTCGKSSLRLPLCLSQFLPGLQDSVSTFQGLEGRSGGWLGWGGLDVTDRMRSWLNKPLSSHLTHLDAFVFYMDTQIVSLTFDSYSYH